MAKILDTSDYEPPDKILVAVDPVVFTIMHDELHILLVKRKWPPFRGYFALPGGFVKEDEDLVVSVKRELVEETGVKNIFLKKTDIYDKVKRDPRGRVISVSFLALISAGQTLKASTDAVEAAWYPVKDLPVLAFEHNLIIEDTLKHLKYEIQTTNIAYQILSKKFTLSEMQNLYEQVLGKTLDKRNFRKRIKELELLAETKEKRMDGAHRPAMLYSFKDKSYRPIKDKIQVFI